MRSTDSRTSGRSSAPDGPRLLGLREFPDETCRVASPTGCERYVQPVVVRADGEIVEGREDLASRAFRGDAQDVRDDEVLTAEALACNNLLLNLAHFPARELGFGPEQDRADPRLALAAALGHPVEVVARHVDRPIPVRQASLVRREHQIASHRFVNGQAATHSLAHHPVEEVRLAPVDEHEEEIERKLLQRADVVIRTGREMIEDRLLEAVRLRIRPEGRVDVPRVAQRGADLVRFRALAFERIRDVRLDSLLEFSADNVPADDVCDRADGAEPLQAKEIREAAERTDLAGGLLRDWNRSIRCDREIPQDDLESIAHEVPNLERAVRTREIEDLNVFHPQGLDRLRRDILEGEQLRREGALVLGPRESDSAAADVQSPRQFPHQAVRLPVANAERSDRIPSVDHGRWRGGDLLDHKVFRCGLEGAPEAGGRRQVAFDPDVTFHGPTRAPSPGGPLPRRTPPRALRRLA